MTNQPSRSGPQLTPTRLFLIIAAVLFLGAALLAFGTLKASISIEGLALLAFAFWVGSGAV